MVELSVKNLNFLLVSSRSKTTVLIKKPKWQAMSRIWHEIEQTPVVTSRKISIYL